MQQGLDLLLVVCLLVSFVQAVMTKALHTSTSVPLENTNGARLPIQPGIEATNVLEGPGRWVEALP